MTNLNVQIPNSLYKQIEAKAAKENVPIDQLVAIALSAQVSAWATKDYVEARKARGSLDKFKQVLSKVPDVEPEDYDKLS
ncbi:hypothetical protein DSM106972_068110 [Dulcicalothrix desertica PCC 7102]|uniref:CopG family transcriptional regulator n=1 Tax=Dulcicalothrix desertica PCC 7102 TaxID=232991 RepID=A0A3S1CGU3_9CYAN|nr:hypothetical protein [Dulcicalothrix desertica]RUT01260.1 hypothetical protein DSM106972_068110 [Dulcicalothrix desertica PCC 7102]TWH40589.1 hypothetical protein CAL7102_09932 [Dulcicalothrix desertica PCC 7102]